MITTWKDDLNVVAANSAVTANGSCEFQWLQPMGAVNSNGYSQWELWIPIDTSNGSCGYQWTPPMGAVNSNSHSQWEL